MNLFAKLMERPALVLGAGGVLAVGALAYATMEPRVRIAGPGQPLSLVPVQAPTENVNPSGLGALAEMEQAMTQLAANVSESVVQIRAGRGGGEEGPMGMGMPSMGTGSGFVYRQDGWIITNDHVVQSNDKVTVILADGREVEGTVRRADDMQADIAVVKIGESGLRPLKLADSSSVKIGQFAMAVGSPFDLRNSVSFGHVSALGRRGIVPDPMRAASRGYNAMIQTDASINPGNSGGPLVNLNGEVIGINTTIYSTMGTPGSIGIGFALPSNQARVVADLLIDRGSVKRGFLGIEPSDMERYEQKKLNLREGAIVRNVTEGSPAMSSGLRENDVITKIGADPIRNELDLRLSMYRHQPGTQVDVTYVRNGNPSTVQVTVGEPPRMTQEQQDEPAMPRGPQSGIPERFRELFPDPFGGDQPQRAPAGRPRLGVEVAQIDGALREQYKIPAGVNGVVVMNVMPESLAERVGLKPGDVIEEVGGKKITSPQDLTDRVREIRPGTNVQIKSSRFGEGRRQQSSVDVPFR